VVNRTSSTFQLAASQGGTPLGAGTGTLTFTLGPSNLISGEKFIDKSANGPNGCPTSWPSIDSRFTTQCVNVIPDLGKATANVGDFPAFDRDWKTFIGSIPSNVQAIVMPQHEVNLKQPDGSYLTAAQVKAMDKHLITLTKQVNANVNNVAYLRGFASSATRSGHGDSSYVLTGPVQADLYGMDGYQTSIATDAGGNLVQTPANRFGSTLSFIRQAVPGAKVAIIETMTKVAGAANVANWLNLVYAYVQAQGLAGFNAFYYNASNPAPATGGQTQYWDNSFTAAMQTVANALAASGNASDVEIWMYNPSGDGVTGGNPGGITGATFTNASGLTCRGAMAEFACAAGTVPVLDGSPATLASVTPATALGPASTPGAVNGGLVVGAAQALYGTAGPTWSTPAGYTLIRAQGAIQSMWSSYYQLGATPGVEQFTGSVSSSATQSAWSALIAAFREAAALSITSGTPPGGTTGTAYGPFTFTAAGGSGSGYSWAQTAGTLPAGLALAPTGALTGTPTPGTSGTYPGIGIKVTDSAGNTASATYSITIAAGSTALAITTLVLAAAVTGRPYSGFIQTTGGTPPTTVAVLSGALPAGITLGSDGTLGGQATSAAGTYGFVARATDSASHTADQALSITVVTAPAPAPPPAVKSWHFLVANPQPDGTYLDEIAQARTRQLIMRQAPTTNHEINLDMNGLDVQARATPLAADLHVLLNGKVLAVCRRGAEQDAGDPTGIRYTPTALDYKELLRARAFYFGGGPAFPPDDNGNPVTDRADICWFLIRNNSNTDGFGHPGVQNNPGGNLGISRGLGSAGLGVASAITYNNQQYAGQEIDNLAQFDTGFDWDITPYGPADLRFDLWPGTWANGGGRGTDKGVVIYLDGPEVASWTRTVDPSTYANSVYVIGTGHGGQTTVESDSDGGTISNIKTWSSPSGGVLDCADTSGFRSAGWLRVHASGHQNALLSYTGTTAHTFTGCRYVSGASGATVSKGNAITELSPRADQFDVADIATRPEGRWDKVITTSYQGQASLDSAAAWYLQDGQVILPSYSIVMAPGWWDGPDHCWIGDTVRVRLRAAGLAIDDRIPVSEMQFDISTDNTETVTLTAGKPAFRLRKYIPSLDRRLRAIESR
jgi:hypothetical protein